jgi:hypothetical protein
LLFPEGQACDTRESSNEAVLYRSDFKLTISGTLVTKSEFSQNPCEVKVYFMGAGTK